MGERRGTKALELWCRRITEGYPAVCVQNMTTSWKDGLAFCAMIHHFRPDLIDFDSLDKNDVYGNNELAFRIAEQHLGIPALLDAEDMASCSVPDRLSILTYLSQFYRTFNGSSPTRVAVNRTTDTIEEKIAQVPEASKEKEATCSGMRKDQCAVCRLPIFLAEKLVLSRVAYHRTCFRCARCSNQLTPGNYYETENSEYCCETCPDEEILSSTVHDLDESVTHSGTENDEVDSSSKLSITDDESKETSARKLEQVDTSVPELIAQTSRLRLNFISNQLLSQPTDEETQGSRNSINREEGKDLAASLESQLDKKNAVEEGNGGLTNTNRVPSNTDEHAQREDLVGTTEDKSILRAKDQDDDPTNVGSCSLVQERLKMFESKKDRVENDRSVKMPKLKNTEKREEIEKSEEPITSSEIIDNGGDASRIESLNADSLAQMPSKEASKDSAIVEKDETSRNVVKDATKINDDYPEELNPFKSDEEEESVGKPVGTLRSTKESTNPFDDEEDEEEEKNEVVPPKPAMRNTLNSSKADEQPTKRRLIAPKINLNPFWSDDDEHESDLETEMKTSTPVPKPRTINSIQEANTNERRWDRSRDDLHASNSSLRTPESGTGFGGTYRKKKPAPLPPNKKELSASDQRTALPSKPQNISTEHHDSSTHTTPKARKTKPAPPPPIPTTSNSEQSLMTKTQSTSKENNVWEDQKTNKDETNRNRQSFPNMSSDESFHYRPYLDKSVEGKWKRKKGPAPPCPMPHRRKIKVMSLKDVKLELDEIEMQQQGLEKQGVRLEQLIRSKCETGSRRNDVCLGTDVEELVLELFALVNEKNELFRRQAELMLLRRQQRLEEEHAEIEYQIRCLMSQHESTKTDFDKQREEALIQRLVEIVEKRNEIVDCLEMDRRREMEEDRSINRHMDLFAAKNKNESPSNELDASEKKKRKQNKSKEKAKEKKLKKTFKKDIDKDVDEIELTLKRHTKRKWF